MLKYYYGSLFALKKFEIISILKIFTPSQEHCIVGLRTVSVPVGPLPVTLALRRHRGSCFVCVEQYPFSRWRRCWFKTRENRGFRPGWQLTRLKQCVHFKTCQQVETTILNRVHWQPKQRKGRHEHWTGSGL